MKDLFHKIGEESHKINLMSKNANDYIQEFEDKLFQVSTTTDFFITPSELSFSIGYSRLTPHHKFCMMCGSDGGLIPLSTAPADIKIQALPHFKNLLEQLSRKLEFDRIKATEIMKKLPINEVFDEGFFDD